MDIAELVKLIKNGEEEKVKTALEKHAKISPKNMKVLVNAAIEADNSCIIVLLLEKGVNENALLDTAVNCDKENIIKLLIDRGASANDGLYFAVKANKTSAIRILLDKGADINTDKRQGSTPLHAAITQKCDANFIRFLIENGANCNARTKNNKTALDLLQALMKGKNDQHTEDNFLKIEDLLKMNTASDNEFECLQGLPDGLSGYSYQIKLFTLYAVINTKRAITTGSKYELGTEVTAALPFDDIYLRIFENGDTSYCRFVQVKQTKKPYLNKIHQSNFFTILKSEKNMKEYVKGHDTIVKMFVKFNEINDSLSLRNGDFVYCANTNFADISSNCFTCEETISDDLYYGISKQKWSIQDWRYLLLELKYVLLNFVESSSNALNLAEEEHRSKFMEQIRILDDIKQNDIKSQLENTDVWPVSKIVKESSNIIENYLDYLETCKLQIKNAADIECVKKYFPEECDLPQNTEDFNIFKNSAIDKINEAFKRVKNDKDIFLHFQKFDDNMIREKICNFIKHFCIYTECPSSDELDTIITKEISEEFQYHNSEFLYVYCVQYLTKWVSSFKNKRGQFFTDENGKGLFDTLKGLIFKGLSEAYVEKTQTYGIKFKNENKKLLEFLNTNDEKHFLHVVTENTYLNAMKILQTLKRLKGPSLNYSDNFLCTNSEIIFTSEIMLKNIVGALLSEFSYNLIEFPEGSKICENLLNTFIEDLKIIIKKIPNKKIIVISKRENVLVERLKHIFKKHDSFTESVTFKDIVKESQDIILDKIVNFQNVHALTGENIRMKELFDVLSASEIIDENMLSEIIKKREIMIIGDTKAFHSDEYNTEYYISRFIQHQPINVNTLENIDDTLYFITGISKDLLLYKIYIEEEFIYIWDEDENYDKGIILMPDSVNNTEAEKADRIFTLICERCESKVIWLEFKGDLLFWKGIRSDTHDVDAPQVQTIELDDNKVNNYAVPPESLNQKIVILSNHPGEGKSTVLTALAIALKIYCPTLWIVRIDLKDYVSHKSSTSLMNINFTEEDTSKAVDLISRMVIKGDHTNIDVKIEKTFFQAALKGQSKSKVILLFDGFDEISPDYKEKACVLLKAIKKSNVKQIWVTTRVQIKTYLEHKLQTPACMLTNFTREQQIEFLNKYWKWLLKNCDNEQEDMAEEQTIANILEHLKCCLENYTHTVEILNYFESINKVIDKQSYNSLAALQKKIEEELNLSSCAEIALEKWKLSIRDDHNFTKVPLNLKMLAENIFKSKWQISKFENSSLFELYKQFIDYKLVNIYQQNKSTAQRGNQADIDLVDVAATIFRKMHRELAVKTLFQPTRMLPELDVCSEFRNVYEKLTRIGLVRTRGNYVEFVHRSYAEYFFSEYFCIHLKHPYVQREFLVNIFVNDNYHLIRTFFDAFCQHTLTLTLTLTKQNPDNGGWNNMILQSKTPVLVPDVLQQVITHHNNRGEGALHVASTHGHAQICLFILINANSCSYPQMLSDLIMQHDNEEQTALHLAAQNNKIEICRIILEIIKKIHNLFKELITKSDVEGRTALHRAAWIGNTEICESILEAAGDEPVIFKDLILKCDEDGWTALHTAAREGHKQVCRIIMDNVRKHDVHTFEELVMKGDLEGQTALYVAAKNNKINVCDIIIEAAKIVDAKIVDKLIRYCDDEQQSILYAAAWEGHRAVCEFIIETIDRDISKENYELFEYIIMKQDALQQTVLHAVAFKGHKDACDFIMETVKENSEIMKNLVMKCDDEGETALETALWARNKEVYDLILKSVEEQIEIFEALIMKDDVNGQTILHKIAQKGNDIVCAIIMETIKKYPEILRKLVIKCDQEGQTALHISARQGNDKVCKTIIENAKQHPIILKEVITKSNNKWQSCLHEAILYENRDIVDVILMSINRLPDVLESLLIMCDHEKHTVLHYAAVHDNEDLIFLIWFRSKDHPTIFHNLVLKQDIKGQTVLHVLASKNHKHGCILLLEAIKQDKNTFKSLIMQHDNKGETAAKIALMNANKDVFNIISQYIKQYTDAFNDHTIKYSNGDENIFDLAFSEKNILVEKIVHKVANRHAFKEWVTKTNNKGQTILHSAVGNDNIELFKIIIENVKDYVNIFSDLVLKVDEEGKTILHVSALEGNRVMSELIVKTIKTHHDLFHELIMIPDEFSETFLHLAAWKGDSQIFETFLDSVKEHDNFKDLIGARDEAGETVLHIAARKSNKEVTEIILNNLKTKPALLADIIMECDLEKQTVLHKASKQVNNEITEIVIYAVKNNSEILTEFIMKVDTEEQTALHTAAWKGNGKACGIILFSIMNEPTTLKSLILKCDENGQTALHLSTSHGNEEACKVIIEIIQEHPDILTDLIGVCDIKGQNVLHTVAWHGNRESCEIIISIIKEHSNILEDVIHTRDCDGQTAVHLEAWHDTEQVWDIILQVAKHYPAIFKRLIMICNNKGQTPLHVSAISDNSKACTVMLKNASLYPDVFKEFVMKRDSEGQTALHLAAWEENIDAFDVILENVKEYQDIFHDLIMTYDNQKCTALHYAAMNSCMEILNSALEKAKAYPDVMELLRVKFIRTEWTRSGLLGRNTLRTLSEQTVPTPKHKLL